MHFLNFDWIIFKLQKKLSKCHSEKKKNKKEKKTYPACLKVKISQDSLKGEFFISEINFLVYLYFTYYILPYVQTCIAYMTKAY